MPDGRWSLDAAPPSLSQAGDPALGQMQSDTAATGLALLAYLGAGYTHRSERYRTVVDRGLTWLIDRQRPDGDLFTGGNRFTRLYSHGIGAIALCEAYGMTRDLRLREPASRAIRFVVDAQSPELGGWHYVPREESDTSVTGWQLMAMASARMSGLDVPEASLAKVDQWLDLAGSPDGARYAYNPHAAGTPQQVAGRWPNLPMTAEGLLMRMYQGWPSSNPSLRTGADYLLANLPEQGTAEQPRRDAYYWYYATQVMFHMEGTYWNAWNERLRPMLERTQVRGGPWAGSWHPTEPVPDRWGAAAGRLYVTAMHLLVLEVYYRHLPLFRHPQLRDPLFRHPRPK